VLDEIKLTFIERLRANGLGGYGVIYFRDRGG
jgi:hypothetical protein